VCLAPDRSPDRKEQRLESSLLAHPAPDSQLHCLTDPVVVHRGSDDHDPETGPSLKQPASDRQPVLASEVEVEGHDLETALDGVHPDLLLHPEAHLRVAELRRWARSGYTVSFEPTSKLHQRVLLPAAEDEAQGLEDARFIRFTHDDGRVDYRATYTAYDGVRIGNRLLISPDLQKFSSWPLSGPGARNKGMALFPRRVGGKLMALSRADGMTIGVTTAKHGYVWKEPVNIEGPTSPWQILQVGNASPPLETSHGWLVVTHGVGLMRSYSLGAILLDLDDPTIVLAKLERPLLPPAVHGGYVPNVVFSCGAIIQGGRLFIPYGVGDAQISVASLDVEDLIAEMTPRR